MIFSFLTPENIGKKYQAAKDYTSALTETFPENERIARNRPHNNTPKEYPKTTDGTTASIVSKTGKRVVQQLPTGKIECDDDNSWLPVVSEFIYTHKILPFANEEYDLVQKCWTTIERGLTFGSSATYTPFLNHGGHFSTDMTLPYWGDVFIQPGKKSGYVCDYVFIRDWWQSETIESIIDKEKKLEKQAKENGEDYEGTWDLAALKTIKNKISTKDDDATTPHEEEADFNPEGVEVVTGFQVGVGAKFYTFCPTTGADDGHEVTILRTKKNKDPRGKMPIDWFYADLDGSNPLGRGVVDLLRGIQNLIDTDMQMYQYNRALMLAPPIQVFGDVPLKSIAYAPNKLIKMGGDPKAKLIPLNIDTTAVTRYPELYGLQKSQLLNLVSSPDTSISAEIGNPGFGKTPAALNQQQANISIDDNYLRKMFEAWFENWSETALNLYFAERQGVEELQLDKQTADRLRKLAAEGKFDINQLSEDNKILIDYDTATPALKFRVDASTSKMKDDIAQGQILTDLMKGIDSSPLLAQLLPPQKVLSIYNRMVANSGVEDPEDLTVDIEEFIQTQEQQQEMASQQATQEQAMLASGQINPDQIAEAELVKQQPIDPQEEQLMNIGAMLQDAGVPDELVADAMDMAQRGASPDDVITALQEVMSDARG